MGPISSFSSSSSSIAATHAAISSFDGEYSSGAAAANATVAPPATVQAAPVSSAAPEAAVAENEAMNGFEDGLVVAPRIAVRLNAGKAKREARSIIVRMCMTKGNLDTAKRYEGLIRR